MYSPLQINRLEVQNNDPVDQELKKRLTEMRGQRMLLEREARIEGRNQLLGRQTVVAGTVSSDGQSGFHN